MGWYQDELYERAQEQWIENFIEDNEREPTEEEIEDATEDAYSSYLGRLIDSTYDRIKEGD